MSYQPGEFRQSWNPTTREQDDVALAAEPVPVVGAAAVEVSDTNGPTAGDFVRAAPPPDHYAAEVWRLAAGLAELGIGLDPGPVDQAPVSTALNRLEIYRSEGTRPPGTPCSPGQSADGAEAAARARTAQAARAALGEASQEQLAHIARELAKGVVDIARTTEVPHTFWHTDGRIKLACRVLGLTPDRAREAGLDDLAAAGGHDW